MPNGGPDHPGTSVEELGRIADKLGVERDDVENHGKLVEHGTTDEVFLHPQQQYTRDLLDAIPGGKLELGLNLD